MAKGIKTGGRVKGSQNKRTQATAAAIESAGVSPLEYMLSVLRDTKAEPAHRMEAARSAAPYVHPKLANIEMSGRDGGPLEIKIVQFSNHSKQLAAKGLPNGGLVGPGSRV